MNRGDREREQKEEEGRDERGRGKGFIYTCSPLRRNCASSCQ